MTESLILDMTAGFRQMWFNINNTIFCDKEQYKQPDIICDFKHLPLKDSCVDLVVFDPPHLINLTENSYFRYKYGSLEKETWPLEIKNGFDEGIRVLKEGHFLIFKWSEHTIPLKNILSTIKQRPLFGHKTIKDTIWLTFEKVYT